ncbi:uncharacterized protein [Antedon mediterranea]|uniref:uncharacterized protein n=1 Tax=Antedon mediterranea TaxID=105859 RepID=UPI003AF856C0
MVVKFISLATMAFVFTLAYTKPSSASVGGPAGPKADSVSSFLNAQTVKRSAERTASQNTWTSSSSKPSSGTFTSKRKRYVPHHPAGYVHLPPLREAEKNDIIFKSLKKTFTERNKRRQKRQAAAGESDGFTYEDLSSRLRYMQAQLYRTIHDTALPKTSDAESYEHRLTMIVPGKVLNQADYDPALNLANYQDGDEIPASTVENEFRLADVIPDVTLTGGDTSRRLSLIYKRILNYLVPNEPVVSEALQQRRKTAENYLLEEVKDPVTQDTKSRLQQFRHYRQLYYTAKDNLERELEEKKESTDIKEYRTWFTRHFTNLNNIVESTYLDWLLIGFKNPVEDAITLLDTSNSAIELEASKVSLRASETTSIDRTSLIYPVTMTPSNWYGYLKYRELKKSRSQLMIELVELEKRKLDFESGVDVQRYYGEQGRTEKAGINITAEKIQLKEKQTALEKTKFNCRERDLWFDDCADLTSATGAYNDEYNDWRNKETKYLRYDILDRNEGALVPFLQNQIDQINADIALIKDEIDAAALVTEEENEIYSEQIAEDNEYESKWTTVEFTSKSSQTDESSIATTSSFSTSASAGYSGWFFGVSASASHSESHSYANSKTSFKSLEMSGSIKILRVSIDRGWFNPSIFANAAIGVTDPTIAISPGPVSNLEDIGDAYELPVYSTGLLLVKDVRIRLQGLDYSTESTIIQSSSSTSGGVGGSYYGLFGLSVQSSSSRSSDSASFYAESNEDGLTIVIPGAQILGYYNDVTPKFP